MYYVAVDSDILRAFACVATGKNAGKVDNNCNLLKYHEKNLKKLKQFIADCKLKLVITETVYGECNTEEMPLLKKFMNDPNYFVIVPTIDRDLVHSVAESYCYPVELDDGTVIQRPMISHYNAALGRTSPTNDCYIMAEAAILGINLLTFNYKDFMLYSDKPSLRVAAIAAINKELGLVFKNASGQDDVSRPLKIDQFIDDLRHDKFILATDVPAMIES
ncbi:MAG: hypothetical protein IJ542_00330 [Clostridia bacterium]|nr:hypothetical protein [Clostridia bacterium]